MKGIRTLKRLGKKTFNSVYRITEPVPRLMLEGTDQCNLSCEFCSNKDIRRHKKEMDKEIFYRAVDQYVDMGGKTLRPYSTGEPLMGKNFMDFITYACSRGLEVRFTSNGQLLTEKVSRQLLDLGVQSINRSIEGTSADEYESIRTGGSFDRVRNNLATLLEMRKKTGLKRPCIRIQTVLSNDQENTAYINKFRHVWGNYCDSIIFNSCGTQGGNQAEDGYKVHMENRTVCDFFFNLLCINNDGTVSCCCVDYKRELVVGDIKKQTLDEIWKGDKMKYFRKMARQKKYEKIATTCAACTSISRSALERSKKVLDLYSIDK